MTLELKVAALVEAAGAGAAERAQDGGCTAAETTCRIARARRDAALRYARFPAQAAVDFHGLCVALGHEQS